MSIYHLNAIFIKNMKDTLRNFQVLILFLVFPVIGFVMTQSITDVEGSFFISIFAGMHYIFTPIVVTASLVSEEKEKNTLRVLRMSGISSFEFFLSTTIFVLIFDVLSGCTFIGMTNLDQIQTLRFLIAGIAGCLISILIGLCVGTYVKSSSAANGVAVPLGMIFSFLPMLSSFNKGLEKVTKYLYGQQVSYICGGKNFDISFIMVVSINFLIVFVIYCYLYYKSKLVE